MLESLIKSIFLLVICAHTWVKYAAHEQELH